MEEEAKEQKKVEDITPLEWLSHLYEITRKISGDAALHETNAMAYNAIKNALEE